MNPAIEYRKQMNQLDNNKITDAKKWEELYKQSQNECTHEDKQGNSTWTELNDGFIYCKVCEQIRRN